MQHGHGADGREEFHVGPEGVHGHLHCATCGGRWEIRAGAARAIIDGLRASDGFEVDLSHVTVVGTCADCAAAAAAARRRDLPGAAAGGRSRASSRADVAILGIPFGVPYPSPGQHRRLRRRAGRDPGALAPPRQLRRPPRLRPRRADAGRAASASRGGRRRRGRDRGRRAGQLGPGGGGRSIAAGDGRHPDRARRRRLGPDPGAAGLRRRAIHSPSSRSTRTSTSATRSAACATATPRRCVARPRCLTSGGSCRSGCAASAAPARRTWPMRARRATSSSPRVSCASGAWTSVLGELPRGRAGLHLLRPRRARPLGRAGRERRLPAASRTTRRATWWRRGGAPRRGGVHRARAGASTSTGYRPWSWCG